MAKPPRSHRQPPTPPWFTTASAGQCKFCGKPVFNRHHGGVNKRAQWHPHCALQWSIMSSPSDARRFVFLRDRGTCATCGVDCSPSRDPSAICATIMRGKRPVSLGDWELDHIRPLAEAQGDPSFYRLDNMQTLCHTCHGRKTRAEVAARKTP
jgi:5-methylcytosine-specific restriction endonuclease McrA